MRVIAALAALLIGVAGVDRPAPPASFLSNHLLVTWYGNPRTAKMGVLGAATGTARADALRAQADAYAPHTTKSVAKAYHLVAVIAQCDAGRDGLYRRRETADVIDALLAEARANGFLLILDIQVGRSTVADEVAALSRYLREPDVHLAVDPEFAMGDCEIPGRTIGAHAAADVNDAIDALEQHIRESRLPPKVLIVHQFRLDMLPDKKRIRSSASVDLVLDMDGFGNRALKRASYRAVMAQGALAFAGIKLFYRQDTNLFAPADVLALQPVPSVVIYQ